MVVFLAGTAAVVTRIWFTDSSRVVPVDEAVDRFRDDEVSTSAAPTSPPDTSIGTSSTTPDVVEFALPEPGVYRYATIGGESIDAMGGVDRTYPAVTTITVTPRGCGVHLVWVALEERREEWDLCVTPNGVARQPDAVQFHEFFGQAQLDEVRCDRVVDLIASDPATPEVAQACTLGGDPWSPRWEVLERTSRAVEGSDVDVTHLRMTVDDTDEYWEETTIDWYLADSGLPVFVEAVTTSRSPSIVGAVVYDEAYELELRSLTPLT